MNRVQKILVLVNFSDDSANGLNYAASLAEETQAELVVLHVTKREEAHSFFSFVAVMEGWPTLNTPSAIPIDRLVRERALDLYRFIEGVIRYPGRVKIRRKVALGHEEEKIVGIAREENIDLVVLGIRNKLFSRNLMARAKFLKMISRLPCPVLLKPAFGKPWPSKPSY
jgi:nucleotide-binding universal stress UspA family protein